MYIKFQTFWKFSSCKHWDFARLARLCVGMMDIIVPRFPAEARRNALPAASHLLQKTDDTHSALCDISSPFLPTLHASLHFRFRWLIPSRDGASQERWKRNSSRFQPNSTPQGTKHNPSQFRLTSIVFLTGTAFETLFEHLLSELNCFSFNICFRVNPGDS